MGVGDTSAQRALDTPGVAPPRTACSFLLCRTSAIGPGSGLSRRDGGKVKEDGAPPLAGMLVARW
jgi:hypothetical protein